MFWRGEIISAWIPHRLVVNFYSSVETLSTSWIEWTFRTEGNLFPKSSVYRWACRSDDGIALERTWMGSPSVLYWERERDRDFGLPCFIRRIFPRVYSLFAVETLSLVFFTLRWSKGLILFDTLPLPPPILFLSLSHSFDSFFIWKTNEYFIEHYFDWTIGRSFIWKNLVVF